jgi:hypothetical protein
MGTETKPKDILPFQTDAAMDALQKNYILRSGAGLTQRLFDSQNEVMVWLGPI